VYLDTDQETWSVRFPHDRTQKLAEDGTLDCNEQSEKTRELRNLTFYRIAQIGALSGVPTIFFGFWKFFPRLCGCGCWDFLGFSDFLKFTSYCSGVYIWVLLGIYTVFLNTLGVIYEFCGVY